MRIKDLTFVEQKLLPNLLKVIPDSNRFCGELMQSAADNAAAEAARKEAQAKGEVGLPKVAKRASTRPISPKLTQTRPPLLPEPERISAEIKAKEVPGFIERTNLQQIQAKRQEDAAAIKGKTLAKYQDKNQLFKFHETKGVRPVEDVRREINEAREKELQFDASYYHPPPDFSKLHKTDFKANAAAILREDYLYRKQQAKDAEILRNYEEELRDPTEYYLWQQQMREADEVEKLKHVALRREQAKQSAEEAKLALERQREDNALVASMVRKQGEMIKEKKQIEQDIEILQKQETVQQIIAQREVKPQEALQKVLEKNEEIAKQLREELEEKRRLKAEEDRLMELEKADKIRQLRAINTVHKKHIVVFDPTETAGIGLLDEMSYMEMKERQRQEKIKQEELVVLKRGEIEVEKTKKQLDLERRSQSIQRARALKAQANAALRTQTLESRQREAQLLEETRQQAAKAWDSELQRRNSIKAAEQAALHAEQERIQRQQQYLGVAQGQVAAMREEQMQKAKARQEAAWQSEYAEQLRLAQETESKERRNKTVLQRERRLQSEHERASKAREAAFEKSVAMARVKDSVMYKKTLYKDGQEQHQRAKTVLYETNPYGAKITEEVRTLATLRTKQ